VEPRILDISGKELSTRLMDESYVMCEDEKQKAVTLGIHCRRLSPCWPNPLYSTYYRKLLDAYRIGRPTIDFSPPFLLCRSVWVACFS
jgi:hypothetical protein